MTSPVGSLDDLRNPLVFAPEIFENNIGVGFTPIQVIIYEILRKFNFYQIYILTSLLSLTFIYLSIKKISSNKIISVCLLLNYPIIFCLARANNDIWLLGLLTYYLYFTLRKKQIYAAFSLGVITSIDPIFLLYSIIFLSTRCKKFWVYYIPVNLILYTLPILIFNANPVDQMINIVKQYLEYNQGMVSGDGGLLFGNSFLGLIKIMIILLFDTNHILKYMTIFQSLLIIISLIIIVYFRLTTKMNKDSSQYLFILVTCVMILFYSAAPDYKLIFLVPSLALLVKNSKKEEVLLFIIINIVLLPKYFVWFRFDFNPTGFAINSILNPILLLIIISFSLKKLIKRGY